MEKNLLYLGFIVHPGMINDSFSLLAFIDVEILGVPK
jgi:hypothetical protein